MYGSVRARAGAFHFWDATDDFTQVNMDLLLEGDRLYLHNAHGHFGAAPLTMTGVALLFVLCRRA